MLSFLKNLLGLGPAADLAALLAAGATVVDVRTRGEYQGGHLEKSINLPLDSLGSSLARLDKTKPVITCCASGMRSAAARGILQRAGFAEVYNGGSWTRLRQYEQ